MGLSQCVQTISIVNWVIGGLLGPLASPSLTKTCTNLLSDCLKMLKMFPHGSRRRASTPPPQQELGGPAGFY